jgi:hypothetical protein
MVEKACAKLHGCYENLVSGYIDEGIQELTGFQPEKILIRNERTGAFPHKMITAQYGGADGFWRFLKRRQASNCLMGCSINGQGKDGPQVVDGQPTGLIMNHAYGLLDVLELENPDDPEEPLRLLRLRNPWGDAEWTGAWGTGSEELKKFEPQLLEYKAKLPTEEQFDLHADDGIFFMAFDDWKDTFSTLFVNNDFPDEWTGVRFSSAWTELNSAGLPRAYSKDALQDFARNPQFLMTPETDCEVVLSLH